MSVMKITSNNFANEELNLNKPVLLDFRAEWCSSCKSEMPDFQEKYKLLGKDVQFLMVNMTDGARKTASSASEFIDSQGYTFPVLYDTESSAAYAYGVYALPTAYFIDSGGRAQEFPAPLTHRLFKRE